MIGRRRQAVRPGAFVVSLFIIARALAAPSPQGTWQIENGRGVIAIGPCGGALCGRIVGIDREPGTPMPTDINGQSQCGLTIITDVTPGDEDAWFGRITDPRSGAVYRAKLWVDAQGNLNLRGYVAIPLFGMTQVWHRYTGSLTSACDLL